MSGHRRSFLAPSTRGGGERALRPARRPKEPAIRVQPLEERTRDDLYNRAQEIGIKGRSMISKRELVEAIRARR
jgi:hypothetical protein